MSAAVSRESMLPGAITGNAGGIVGSGCTEFSTDSANNQGKGSDAAIGVALFWSNLDIDEDITTTDLDFVDRWLHVIEHSADSVM